MYEPKRIKLMDIVDGLTIIITIIYKMYWKSKLKLILMNVLETKPKMYMLIVPGVSY